MALTTNLSAGYKLNETSGDALDVLGVNTLVNTGTVTYSAGKIGNAANFTATTMYLGKANPTGLPSGTTAFSMACWVKFTNFDTARYFFGFGGSAAQTRVTMRCDDATHFFIDDNGAGASWTVSTMSVDTWYHFVITYPGSGNIYTGYFNGSSVGTANNGRAPNIGTTVLSIGSNKNTLAAENLVGSLDEVYIWSRAITSGEVSTLYNGGTGRPYPFNTADLSFSETTTLTEGLFKSRGSFVTETATMTEGYSKSYPRISWTKQSENSTSWTNQNES